MGSIPTRSRHTLLAPCALAVFAVLALFSPRAARAQQRDSAQTGVRLILPPGAAADTTPPISPRRAFLYSFLLPGVGQAKLDRSVAGGMFFVIEATALVLAHRSAEDLRIARKFAGDSVPLRFQTDPVTGVVARDPVSGAPIVEAWSVPRYDADWVRTRRLHYEDWVAVLFFNHLFAGADAFVAAQLWDLPTRVSIRQTPFGPLLSASFSFR